MLRRIAPACVLGAFLAVLMATGWVTASPPPLFADFSYTINQNVVVFSDHSTGYNIIRWEWRFGDDTISTEQNPVHTYNAVGSYTVTLTITNGESTYITDTQIVVIGTVPEAHIDVALVSIAMIILGLMAVAISRNNYSRIGAAIIVVVGLIVWVTGSG